MSVDVVPDVAQILFALSGRRRKVRVPEEYTFKTKPEIPAI
jgi:hypothetical protein